MKTVLHVDADRLKHLESFKISSVEKQRFLVYSEKVTGLSQICKYETDEKLCYFTETLTPKFGVKGFVHRTAKEGFSLDKAKKKVSLWYGKPVKKMDPTLFVQAFIDLKQEWFLQVPSQLKYVMTRSMIEKIMLGKMTNPRDYARTYLRTSLKMKDLSIENYLNLMKEAPESLGNINQILRYSKNPNWVLEHFDQIANMSDTNLLQDILKECRILGKKFDWSWSRKRINEEHKLMSREIRGLELEFIADNTIEYKNVPELPEGWELINNQKRLFLEGSEQDHCVYNYWSNVESKTYFVVSIKDGSDRITASIERKSYYYSDSDAIRSTEPRWKIGQIYGKRNSICPEHIRSRIEKWLEDPKIQDFFTQQKNQESNVSDMKVSTLLEGLP